MQTDFRARSVVPLYIILSLGALLLGGCGPHRIVLPKVEGRAFEDHGIEIHFWNRTRATMGPYEVKGLRIKKFLDDQSESSFRKKEIKTLGGKRISFEVGLGGGTDWKAECKETEFRHKVDTLEGMNIHVSNLSKVEAGPVYEGGAMKRQIQYECRFRAADDTGRAVTLMMAHPATDGLLKIPGRGSDTAVFNLRKATTLMVDLHENHAADCMYLERGAETLAIVDRTWFRIYLEKGQPAADKTLWAAVLTALWARQARL